MIFVLVKLSRLFEGLFDKAIVMSGSLFGPWAVSKYPVAAAQSVGRRLGCRSHTSDKELLDCLRSRDVPDILQAFNIHQKNLNTTELFAPVVDAWLPEAQAFFGKSFDCFKCCRRRIMNNNHLQFAQTNV